MVLTFKEYDEVLAKFEKMQDHVCWPSPIQVEAFKENPDKWLMFCVFLYERNPKPETEEEKASRKAMMKFINSQLELVDDEDDEYNEDDADDPDDAGIAALGV